VNSDESRESFAICCHGKEPERFDAHRGDGKRFIVRADELLTAFMEPESAIRGISLFHAPCTVKRHSACTKVYD
jgi:hypothetical protein